MGKSVDIFGGLMRINTSFRLTIIIGLLPLLAPNGSFGQSGEFMTENGPTEIWYDQLVGFENTGLINGEEYLPRLMGRISHPFLEKKEPFSGSLEFDGQKYYDLQLTYDIYQDILILSHNQNQLRPMMLQLSRSKVEAFTLGEKNFKNIEVRDSISSGVSSGYFEVLDQLESGDFVMKWRKVDYLKNARIEFRNSPLYFVYTPDGDVIPLNNRYDYYRFFSAHSSEVKAFIKKNKIRFRNKRPEDFLHLFQFGDSAVKQERATK